jgi:hypothetical protein
MKERKKEYKQRTNELKKERNEEQRNEEQRQKGQVNTMNESKEDKSLSER